MAQEKSGELLLSYESLLRNLNKFVDFKVDDIEVEGAVLIEENNDFYLLNNLVDTPTMKYMKPKNKQGWEYAYFYGSYDWKDDCWRTCEKVKDLRLN